MKNRYLLILLGTLISISGAIQVHPIIAQSPGEMKPSETTTEPPKTENEIDTMKLKLKEALQAKNWREADQITYELMLKVAGNKSSENGRFDEQEWSSFDCKKLREIDQMWADNTGGKLGYSAQRKVFEKYKQEPILFYEAIGWKKEDAEWLVAWTYTTPKGTKPTVVYRDRQEPKFDQSLEQMPEGYLPAKLEWTDDQDHRFEKIYLCKVGIQVTP